MLHRAAGELLTKSTEGAFVHALTANGSTVTS